MRLPGRTIWDTRVQSICGLITARGESGIEVFGSASFAQVSLEPAKVIINPNKQYGIDQAIRAGHRFAINVLSRSQQSVMVRVMKARRRQPHKAEILGLPIKDDARGIPYFAEARRVIFCEVEQEIESGDRNIYVARVLESRLMQEADEPPLLFTQATARATAFPNATRILRTTLIRTGALDLKRKVFAKLRPPAPANIAETTYQMAGATPDELATIVRPGVSDRSRTLAAPPRLQIARNKIGVCVVGTGWGLLHCRYLRRANPDVQLFVCGRDPEKTARVAKAAGAEGYFLGLEEALSDERIQAVTLALPHDLHRNAAEMAAAAGKHVLVEKPIATSLSDADAMIAAAQNAGTILMVAENMHFRPAVREAVHQIETGAVGEPLYLLAHAGGVRRPEGWAADKKRMGGGVLIDIGVHYIRALRLLLGEPDRVLASRAMQINPRISGEDSVQILFSNKTGWEAHMLLSWASQRGHLPDIVLAGEKGTLHLWPQAKFLDFYPVEPRLINQLISYVRPYSLQEKLQRPQWQRMRFDLTDPDMTGYLGEMQEFMAAISENRQPVTSAADGRRDLEIAQSCYESLERGEWVPVTPIS